ncbi:lytic murein transglycosylase B [Kangiella sediminilitoris]|uniref:Lytic murein transglycosylase B n=1 Tax=Kangiella sediminilitoris TaxID=1144748 RepID=A0A1B3BDA0_9GAMM|nr:lytic murein transglycosylase B [Kangiella sediminilitoris]AOE50781.1 Lytic murein transglycosylase B [Kangiella sediminilitoris]
MRKIIVAALLGLSSYAASGGSAPTEPEAFAQHMQEKHGFTASYVKTVLSKAKVKDSIIKLITRPAESKDWFEYRPIFIQQDRIKKGVEFYKENYELLKKAEEKYQVPAEVITAIIGVETKYGRIQGSDAVIDALNTLAFHYPKRGSFFAGELEQYFVLAREQGWEIGEPKGSYAGAMGMGQFIPTSYRHYAVDFDGDGKINLFNNTADAIGSVANYFSVHGWKLGEPVAEFVDIDEPMAKRFKNEQLKPQFTISQMKQAGLDYKGAAEDSDIAGIYHFKQKNHYDYWLGFHNFYVITRYNRSPLYAMAVHQLSQEIEAEFAIHQQKEKTHRES